MQLLLAASACTDPTFSDAGADAELDETTRDAGSAVAETGDAASAARSNAVPPDPDQRVRDDAGGESQGNDPSDGGQSVAASDGGMQGSDADSLVMASSDAGTGGGLPAWAMPLIGTYAKRSITFSYDDDVASAAVSAPFNTRNLELSILKIAQNGSELGLTSQMCANRVTLQGPGQPLVFKNADKFPLLRGAITLGPSNTFVSTDMVHHLGFDPSPARTAMCTAGGRREKFKDQSWIAGTTCTCSATTLPEDTTDCRVIDGDADGRPGITWNGPLLAASADFLLVFDYTLKFVDGRIGSDGAPELRELRTQTASCINADIDYCRVGHNQLCPGGSTQLVRLETSQATCADIDEGAFDNVDEWPTKVDCR